MARGSSEYGSMAEWLNSPSPGKGGGGSYLKDWKEKGEVDVWLHTKRMPLIVWRHAFPEYVVLEDRETKEKVKHVFNKKKTCHETEDILDALYWRDKETGERKHPPQRCGLCKFDEWLYQQCILWLETHSWDAENKVWTENKKGGGKGIDPCKIAFKFVSEAENPEKENISLRAGGICGLFGKKDLDDDLVAAMKANKIKGTEAWKQNCKAKPFAVFCVVNNNDIKSGVVVASETKALGEKTKEIIAKMMKSHRDIQKKPYALKWEFDKDADFDKKYDVTPLLDMVPSGRVLKLIRGDAPSLDKEKEPFNQQTMRATLEKHCLLKNVPWDELFPSKEQEKKWKKEDEAEAKSDRDAEEAEENEDEEGEEEIVCDECEKPMKMSDTECPHCGHEYDVDGDEEEEDEEDEEDEKPAKKKVSAKSKSSKKKDEAEEDEDDEDEEEEDDSDDEEEEDEKPVKKKAAAKKKPVEEDDEEDEEEEDDSDDDEEEDDDEDEDEEEEKPVKKKSSVAAKGKNGASPKKKAVASKKKDEEEEEEEDDDEEDDEDDEDQSSEIPF